MNFLRILNPFGWFSNRPKKTFLSKEEVMEAYNRYLDYNHRPEQIAHQYCISIATAKKIISGKHAHQLKAKAEQTKDEVKPEPLKEDIVPEENETEEVVIEGLIPVAELGESQRKERVISKPTKVHLDKDEVAQIELMHKSHSKEFIMKKYDVSIQTVYRIIAGKHSHSSQIYKDSLIK